ncbi:MAG: PPC domain-containing protein [Limnospira sp.]
MAYDTIEDALNIGVIGLEPTETNDRIGFREDGRRERNDYYQFTIEEESDFNLTLDNLEDNANVQILDSDGSVMFRSNEPGRRRETIDTDLEPGTYFVRVLQQGRSQTDYRLSLNADPITDTDGKAPGTDLGILDPLGESIEVSDEIGFTQGDGRDENDYFSFSLEENSDVSLKLDQLRRDANVEILDGDGETVLWQSMERGRQEETINAILNQGDYVVRVSPRGSARTQYRLDLSADEVLPPEELPGTEVGDLTATEEPFVMVEDIGFGRGKRRNQKDYYSFEVSQDASFYANLDQLERDADLFLYEYDPSKGKSGKLGSLMARSRTKGNKPETLSEFLEEGDYAIQVRPKGAAKTNYRLELDAQIDVDDAPTLETAKDLGELEPDPVNEKESVGTLTGDRFRDQADWYKFTLSAEKNVDLTLDELRVNAADAEIYDGDGEMLHRSKREGRRSEAINETFDAGTYYVKVVAKGSGNTDYRLSLSAEEPIDNYDVFELGDLSSVAETSNNDNVGQERSGVRNELDVYNFTLSENTDFAATLDQITQNVNLAVYRGVFDPEDKRGRPVYVSREKGRSEELIGQVLEPGDYHLRVLPVGNAETRYRLGIETEAAGGGTEVFEVGSLGDLKNNEYKEREKIGFGRGGSRNTTDSYNFSLDAKSDFTLTLDEIRRDANVMVLDSEGEMVLTGFNPGRAPEFLTGTLEAGDYTAQVFPVGNAKTGYFLTMNAEPADDEPIDDEPIDDEPIDDEPIDDDPIIGEDPDGTVQTATDLGGDPLTQSGEIGFTEDGVADESDYYKFTLDEADDVQIILGDLKQNANLELLDDSGSPLFSSSNSGSDSEIISSSLDAGDYYLRVYAVGSSQTDYTISFF